MIARTFPGVNELFASPERADGHQKWVDFVLAFYGLAQNANTKLLITTAAQQLLTARTTLTAMKQEMLRLSRQLPEYETVHSMYVVGEITAADG